jgi:organic radical activating enzyme
VQWWNDDRLEEFRNTLQNNIWPSECYKCQLQEKQTGESFRTAINQQTADIKPWPQRWNLKFGHICNLGCWTCNEYSSSVIAQHKKRIDILPENFNNPTVEFQHKWNDLKTSIIKSYNYYDVVTLTLLGGEPLYNHTVNEFLEELKTQGLAPRTKLEFHTNGTHVNQKLFQAHTWKYVCVFLSIDAVGRKAEWLRYGCRWSDIEKNIDFFKSEANYIEVHSTVSVLNVHDLPELSIFCQQQNLNLKCSLLSDPEFMSLLKWSGDKQLITDRDYLKQYNFEDYYDLIGSKSDNNTVNQLRNYINQFNNIRHNLNDYDAKLACAIGV